MSSAGCNNCAVEITGSAEDVNAAWTAGRVSWHKIRRREPADNFLVANYGRQKIIAMPRAVQKVAIFEEAARTLEIPGGVRIIQEYKYR
jgi:hypothetical protein